MSDPYIVKLKEIRNNFQDILVLMKRIRQRKMPVISRTQIDGRRLSQSRNTETQEQEQQVDRWINPVNGRITSPYGWRNNPTNPSVRQFHGSVDIGVPQGTQIVAAAAGLVTVGQSPTFGNFVVLNPESTQLNPSGSIRVITSHMSQVDVETGLRVEAGSVIGLSGGTPGTPGAGISTGPHVDITVREDSVNNPFYPADGQIIDPTRIFNFN